MEIGIASLCLDFANTVEWHASDHPVEHLQNYSDLVAWTERKALLSPRFIRCLNEMAEKEPDKAEGVFEKAVELREAIYRIFSSYAVGGRVDSDDLEILNRESARSACQAIISPENGNFAWTWQVEPMTLDRMLSPILRSATDLLTSDDLLSRVGQCADDRGCGYLFIDLSKNRSRKWCDIKDCGNRAKQRRYYHKTRSN